MPNQTLQQQVASLWLGIRGQKAAQIEEQLRQSRQQVGVILGENYIETITHLSLLKLLAYRLVIFADGCSRGQEGRVGSKLTEKMAEISSLVGCFHEGEEEAFVSVHKYRSLKRKVSALSELMQEPSVRERRKSIESEGMDAMVEQLELLLAKKERRIRELNGELEENFIDKEELEDEIELLHSHNQQLQQELEKMSTEQGQQGVLKELNMEVARLQGHTLALQEEKDALRLKIEQLEGKSKVQIEQERLLFGKLSPKKALQPLPADDDVLNEALTHSSRQFAKKYTQGVPDNTPTTVRKTTRSVMEEWRPEEEEENLLASDRSPFKARRLTQSPQDRDKAMTSPRLNIHNQFSFEVEVNSEEDYAWSQMLLCQAVALEQCLSR